MLDTLFIFGAAIYCIFKWATMATRYAADLARNFHISRYIVGFLIVAVISILPETFVALNTAIQWMPEYWLATLFGSNIADLTLVFAIAVFVAWRGLKVGGEILKSHLAYPLILLVPLLLGYNGHFSRMDWVILLLAWWLFYYYTIKNWSEEAPSYHAENMSKQKSFIMLLVSMGVLLVWSHFTISSSLQIAELLWVNSIIIGMLVVWLGTTIPELFFALQSIKNHDDSLAIGDILGTVLADATIVVGLIAVITPFHFPDRIIYFTGVFMLTAACILFYLMKTWRILTKREANVLFLFWIFFAVLEVYINK